VLNVVGILVVSPSSDVLVESEFTELTEPEELEELTTLVAISVVM
jgi:hypothetical protein